jgi:glutamyl-tRNA synthetase
MDTKTLVRTRIAPSPTGYPHIGTIDQALFDHAYAKKYNGQFLLRLEDTDRSRLVEDAEGRIYEALDWFGLSEDESPRKGGPKGPYKQSERLDIYEKYALELVEKGGAYYCFCSKERLEQMRNDLQMQKKPVMYDKLCRKLSQEESAEKLKNATDWVIRLKVPENTKIVVKDEVRGDIEFDSNLVDDQVLIKSDKFPTYHLAVVVDDHLMEITDIVRGEEWITSFPKHKLIYDYFGWEMPKFYHTSLLRNPDKSKLSKRHGHTSVSWYQENGYLPEAILNFLALLGWSHPEGTEIFSHEEFIQHFELKDLKAVAPIFDLQKLDWINGEYLRMMADEELKKRLVTYDQEIATFNEQLIDALIPLAKSRIKTLSEFKSLVSPFITKPDFELSSENQSMRKELSAALTSIESWNVDSILAALKAFLVNNGKNFKYLYTILIGTDRGLPLVDVFVILGKEKVLELLS